MNHFRIADFLLAESSATTGGLDSLLEPTGNIKMAQEKAARAFGCQHLFFGMLVFVPVVLAAEHFKPEAHTMLFVLSVLARN